MQLPQNRNRWRLFWAWFSAQQPLLGGVAHYICFIHRFLQSVDISEASFPQKILLWTLLVLTTCSIPLCRWIHICIISIFYDNASVGCSHQQKVFCLQLFLLFTSQVRYFLKKGHATDDRSQLLSLGCSLKFGLTFRTTDQFWIEKEIKAWVSERSSQKARFIPSWLGNCSQGLGDVIWIYSLYPSRTFC